MGLVNGEGWWVNGEVWWVRYREVFASAVISGGLEISETCKG